MPPETAILELSDTITGPRGSVANAFAAVAAGHGDATQFEAVAAPARTDGEAYALALEYIQGRGLLLELVHALLNAQVTRPEFVERARKLLPADPLLQELQASQGPGAAVVHPDVLMAVLSNGARNVCRVNIDGVAQGTGFLIAPSLVLTAYHVVQSLAGPGQPTAATASRLTVVFDDRVVIANGVATHLPLITLPVADDWLGVSSGCLPQELVGTANGDLGYLDQIDPTNGPWDFALIRLRKALDVTRTGLRPNDLMVQQDQAIMVLQHANGQPLRLAFSSVKEVSQKRTRFFHTVWTKPGASGGPCLNMEGRVVGIHQAGPAQLPPAGQPIPPNRAVPIKPFVSLLQQAIAALPPLPMPLTNLSDDDDRHPVLGRDQLQQWIFRAAAEGSSGGAVKPILIVASSTPRRGARFSERVLRGLLPADRHLVVSLDAGNFVGHTPSLLASDLVSAVTGHAPSLPGNESDTSEDAWIRKKLVPAALSAIGEARGGRLVWLVLRFPPRLELPDKTKVRETLDAFYAETRQNDWIRLLLLGLGGLLPPPLDQLVELERLRPLGEEDVLAYLSRRWTGDGALADEAFVRAFVSTEMGRMDFEADGHQEAVVAFVRKLDGLFEKARRVAGGGP